MGMKDFVAFYNELYAAALRVRITAEIITPKIANEYLEHNTNNFRRCRPNVVTNYARDMENGDWRLSWDCIAFDEDGNLSNGQHRLYGIVDSGKPQVCFVMRNCPNDLFFGDTGTKRSIGDYLKHSGIADDPLIYSNIGVGALNAMLKFLFTKRVYKPTAFDVQNLVERMPDPDVFATIIQIVRTGPRGINTAPIIASSYAAFVCTNDELVFEFLKELVSGVGQPTVISLRDKLITGFYGTNGAGHSMQINIIKVTQRVIKAYLSGEHLSKLFVPPEFIYMLDDVIDLKRGGINDAD